MEKVSKNTSTKKRILSFFAALLMALSSLPLFAVPYMVDAAEQVHPYLVAYGSAYGQAFVTRPMGDFNKAHSNGWKIYIDRPSGRTVAYCLGYGMPLSRNDLVSQDSTYANLSATQQNLIRRAVTLGYNDTTAITKGLNDWDRSATAIMVWLIRYGYFNTANESWMVDTLANIGNPNNKAEVIEKYYDLKDRVLYATANPSFVSRNQGNAPTYQMTWDNSRQRYTVTLNNTTYSEVGLLYNYFRFDMANGLSYENPKSNPNHNLITANNLISRALATGTETGVVDGSVESWSASGKQPTATFTAGRNDPIPSYFRVEIASGLLNIQKEFTDSSGNEVEVADQSGVEIQIRGQNTGYTATYTTDENGQISQWVPEDTYTITEINTGENWVQPATQTATVLTGETTDVTVTNVKKQWNLTIAKEDQDTGELLHNATFEVYNAQGQRQTDSNGDSQFTIRARDDSVTTGYFDCGSGYYLKEVESPYGYLLDSDAEYPISGTEGNGTATVSLNTTVPNEQGAWKLTVHKTDANDGTELAGIQFQVIQNGVVQTDSNGQSVFTTDDTGSFTTGEFPTGNGYYLQEIDIPDNLTDANGNPYRIGNNTRISGTWVQNAAATLELTQEVANTPIIPVEISIYKYATNTQQPIRNVTFELYDGDGNTIGEYTTDRNGEIYIDGLTTTLNGLRIQETEAPGEYQVYSRTLTLPMTNGIITEPVEETYSSLHQVVIRAQYNEEENVIEVRVEFGNPSVPGTITIRKVDQNGDPIAGVTFGLYASEVANPPEDYMGYAGGQIATATTDENGYATFTLEYNPSRAELGGWYGGLPGTMRDYYYLREESVPDNCAMANPNFWQIAFTQYYGYASSGGSRGYYYWVEFPEDYTSQELVSYSGIMYARNDGYAQTGNISYRGSYSGAYFSRSPDFTVVNTTGDGSVSGYKYGYTSATGAAIPLEGVTIGLFDGDLPQDQMTLENALDTDITGTNGYYEFTGLAFGRYAVKELAGNGDRMVSDTVHTFSVLEQYPTAIYTNRNFYNYHPNSITGIKYGVDHQGNRSPLAGATFGLFGVGTSEFTADTALQLATSSSDGSFSFDAMEANGSYQIVELSAPAGYELSEEIHTVQTRNGFIYMVDGQVYQDGTAHTVAFTFENPLKPVYIEGLKTGTDYTGSTNPLANVIIGLFDGDETNYTSAHALQTITTGEDGLFRFDHLNPNGSYKVVELSAPTGWIRSDTVFSVTFYDGQVQQLSGNGAVVGEDGHSVYIAIDNPQPTVWIEGIKYGISADDTSNPLAGATIGLFDVNVTDYTQANALDTDVTGSDGSFRFDSLNPSGSYKIVELVAPTGYAKSDTVLTAQFVNGRAVGDGGSEDHFAFEIDNEQYAANLRILKDDGNGVLLDGVTFGLFHRNAAEYTSSAAIQTAVTSNGECSFAQVPYGDYTVVELSGVAGHMMDATPQYVTVDAATNGQTLELTFSNPEAPYSIQGTKINQDGSALSGALFGLYWADLHYDTYTDQNAIMTAESGNDGVFSFEGVATGNYLVVELAAPVDANGVEYALDQTPHPVSVTSGSSTVVEIGNIVNVPITNRVWGIKEDGSTGQLLEGVVFGLYAYDDADFSDPLQTATTDSQGVFEFPEVYVGSYWVREISAVGNYELNPTAYPAYVSQPGMEIYVGAVPNYQPGTIMGIKVSAEDSSALEGAKFGLYTSPQSSPSEEDAAAVAVSGSDGVFSFSGLQYGVPYYLYELEAPLFYQVRNELLWSGVVTQDNPVLEIGTITNTLEDWYITGTKVDGNGTVLEGAVFGIFDAGEVTSWEQAMQLYEQGMSEACLSSTGADGVWGFRLSNFMTQPESVDTLVIYELIAPEGYRVLTDPIWTGSLPPTEEPSVIDVGYVYNNPETFDLTGTKVSGDGERLKGAVFGIYDASQVTRWEQATEENAVATAVSNEDGSFGFAGIACGSTTYVVYELQAPEGYDLRKDAIWTGTNTDGSTINLGDVVNYTHQELPGTGGSGQNPIQSALALGLLGCAVIGFGFVLYRANHKKEGDA